jgi:catechol 2,3-dioxygenase-like lactoylglutathione lyase family enzyme
VTISVFAVSIDCADAGKLAGFWADALGVTVNDGATPDSAYVAAGPPLLLFHQVPEAKAGKNRLHLDLISADFAADTERLLGFGASRVRDIEDGGHIRWTTFQDPQGNEFDLIAS